MVVAETCFHTFPPISCLSVRHRPVFLLSDGSVLLGRSPQGHGRHRTHQCGSVRTLCSSSVLRPSAPSASHIRTMRIPLTALRLRCNICNTSYVSFSVPPPLRVRLLTYPPFNVCPSRFFVGLPRVLTTFPCRVTLSPLIRHSFCDSRERLAPCFCSFLLPPLNIPHSFTPSDLLPFPLFSFKNIHRRRCGKIV